MTMESREIILSRVRANRPRHIDHPCVPKYAIAGDISDNFIKHVEQFDGHVIPFNERKDVLDWLSRNVTGKNTLSTLPDWQGSVTLPMLHSPADAHTLDNCISEGIMGIGETGSVVVDARSLGQASNGLLALNLYLLLDREKIVDGLQATYGSLDLSGYQYMAFFSGPSATADIEAVHITGAQGPLSLTVLLYSGR